MNQNLPPRRRPVLAGGVVFWGLRPGSSLVRAGDGDGDSPSVGAGAMFPQEDTLPGPEITPTALDRDGQRGERQDRPDVGGHVVGPFAVVDVGRIPVRGEPRRVALQVA